MFYDSLRQDFYIITYLHMFKEPFHRLLTFIAYVYMSKELVN